jgi:transcriptional regulator with XRE-family HTH domain
MSNRIKEHRERAGLSQFDLAIKVGTTPQQISRLERGDRRIKTDMLPRLAQALDVRQADLLVEVERHAPGSRNLPQDEVERCLLAFWRELSPEPQDFILELVNAWARRINFPPIARPH